MTTFKKGDEVSWKSAGGNTDGTVEKKLTSPTKIKSHEVDASKEDPQYLVKSKNGGEAAHKPDSLKKK